MALLQREGISSMAYPQWVIDGIIPAESVSMVYGPSGKGKSFWQLDQAACVATGRKWNGRAVQQGPVVYVAGEGKSGYKARLEAWERQHRVRADNFWLYDEPVRLWSRDGNRNSMARFIDEVNGANIRPRYIVLDTLATCLGGANENDNGHMRELLDSAEELGRQWDSAITLVHHAGKSESSRTPRGAQALADGVAMHAYMHGDGRTWGVLDCTKQKDGDPFETIRRTLHTVDLGKGAASLAFADELKTGPREKKRRVSWREVRQLLQGAGIPMTPSLVAAALDWDRKAAGQALREAAQRGEVYQPDEGSGAYALVPGYTPNLADLATK